MQAKQLRSINKSVFLMLFICLAIFGSLFFFHLNYSSARKNFNNDFVTMFAVPREIKPFKLTQNNHEKFLLKNFLNHWTLLIFGFTHCNNVCPTTLAMMSQAYKLLQATYPNLQVVMISLDPERDTPLALTQYIHTFHPDFVAISDKIQDLRKIQSQFGVYSARESSSNYQIQHTSSIFLINPQAQWVGIFKYGMSPQQFVQVFTESMKSSSKEL